MKREALNEIKTILMEDLAEPINDLKQLLKPFQQEQDLFMQLVKNVKEAWDSIVTGYVCGSGLYWLMKPYRGCFYTQTLW